MSAEIIVCSHPFTFPYPEDPEDMLAAGFLVLCSVVHPHQSSATLDVAYLFVIYQFYELT